jgi:hypothetical protein
LALIHSIHSQKAIISLPTHVMSSGHVSPSKQLSTQVVVVIEQVGVAVPVGAAGHSSDISHGLVQNCENVWQMSGAHISLSVQRS